MPATAIRISVNDARKLFLHRQGLLHQNPFGKGKGAVLSAIEQLGYLQIDTISVVERAHHHTLLNRVNGYSSRHLERLHHQDRQLFEYWFHAAAYLPIRDYRFYQPMMQSMARRYPADKKVSREVLRRIQNEGPLQSKDFENTNKNKSNGWWDWKPAKRAMERLFLAGELMVTRREGFQKVYDLRENVLPASVKTAWPTEEEWTDFLCRLMINAIGFGTLHDISYIRQSTGKLYDKNVSSSIKNTLGRLCEAGELIEIKVQDKTYYSTPHMLEALPLKLGRKRIRFLSPFDNLVINRKRTLDLFDLDYQIECYVPAAKRKYGYFCLPILYGDRLIGRMDAKADRAKKAFRVKHLQLEDSFRVTQPFCHAMQEGLNQFRQYHGCETISFERITENGNQLRGYLLK